MCAAQAKEMLERAGFEKGGQAVVLGGATIAGFFAAACSLPFDFVKTRIQKMEPNPDGTLPYKGPVDCALKTLREEGFLKFYTGFPTYCIRCGPPSAVQSVPTYLLRMMPLAAMPPTILGCDAAPYFMICVASQQGCSWRARHMHVCKGFSKHVHVRRIAPHVTMTLVALEALKAYEKKIGL